MNSMAWTATASPEIATKTEWYRLEKRAQQSAYIKRLCQQIVEAFHPEKIILFGSRAYGKPRWDSDIDLLVIMPYQGSPLAQAASILRQLNLLAPIDVQVRTPEEIRERLSLGDQFIGEIVERGQIIYEASHKRVGGQG